MNFGARAAPYWWEEAEPQLSARATPQETLPARTDVLVVGAGYSGLSAALTLARAGREVVVVDSAKPGFGCSSRNGGLIGPSFHKMGLDGLTAAFGQPKAHAMLRESMESLAWLKRFISDENIGCGLHLTGRFRGAPQPENYEAIARECEGLARATGLRFEMVPKARQHEEIGSEHYHGGVIYPDDGHLHPGLLALGFAQLVLAAGARIIAPARLTGLRREGGTFLAEVAGRRICARDVVVATNGYTGPELPFFARRVIPIRSAIIATEPLRNGLMAELSPNNRGFGDSSRLVLYYRPSPDGARMVFGGRAFDLSDKPQNYVPDLSRLMHRVFPQLRDSRITHAWSGTVAYTFDHAPHLGSHEGLHFVMGYCGSGVGRAGFYGRKLALKMLGDAEGHTELDGQAFPTRPFYRGRPWFLPAVLRWNSLMDRLGR